MLHDVSQSDISENPAPQNVPGTASAYGIGTRVFYREELTTKDSGDKLVTNEERPRRSR
jgi:hypothetical protein